MKCTDCGSATADEGWISYQDKGMILYPSLRCTTCGQLWAYMETSFRGDDEEPIQGPAREVLLTARPRRSS